jgi:diadenosine tetraphosphate (Ap4A) HIT family hydrolase
MHTHPCSPVDSMLGLADLIRRRPAELGECLRGAFEVERIVAAPLHLGEDAWHEAAAVLRAPRDAVEQQPLVVARDVALGAEAMFNPLRARRIAAPAPHPSLHRVVPLTAEPEACRWCGRGRSADGAAPRDLAVDLFGALYAANGRVRASANWARQAPVSGIIFGDDRMHDVLALSREDFRALFEAAELYVDAARAAFRDIEYFEVFINGGTRSAASVAHAHAQVVGRARRHFAYPETIASRAPADYWASVRDVHRDLGLAAGFDGGVAWANLVPVKERDVTAVSATLPEGADMMHSILQALIGQGTNSFSLTALLAPRMARGRSGIGRFRHWPPVIWRLVDRGDARVRHADIGCLELFGSAVVATDPFDVARWLRDRAAPQRARRPIACAGGAR